ncbi:hypothetical protein BH09DEP1_BH09DEP1_4620 [soil metagenome]
MKLLAFLLVLIVMLPGCCWSNDIPKCRNCHPSKPLDYSYDDTHYNNEITM